MDSLLNIINDILDYSLIASKRLTLEQVPLDLKNVLSDVCVLLRVAAAEKGIELEFDYPADAPRGFRGDPARIRQIDLDDPDYFMASENVYTVAQDSGWWNPDDGPFEFCYAYDPTGRKSFAAIRREWRVFDLVAPSLKLHPNSENFPFSVKPDTLVSVQDIQSCFADTYEGTEFYMTKFMLVEGKDGKLVKSPNANPFMNYDQTPLWKITGGRNRKG